MSEYQVTARKYRPKSFVEVVGQEAIITTLKNAIRRNRLAHAYLFCGPRGTGKTTIARTFAKALNCQQPDENLEPCNQCASCREISSGNSLDVLEIDGASHRGIDDIRQINDTVGYATASGKYKIYIIDEVHMLTKEAFNALLKTLEEPPAKVIFFFATTEPHKVLPTILSRCQRFNLSRIPVAGIMSKLARIAKDQGVSIDEEALRLLAGRADGCLRDAESLFDQIIAFHEGAITAASVAAVLGMMPRDSFFELDRAGKEGQLSIAFDIANQVFAEGKDVAYFIENLIEHFRNILLVKISGKNAPFIALSESDRNRYEASAKLYTQEQCLTILDFLVEAQNQRFTSNGRIALEAILLRILRTHQRIPIEFLVRRLSEIEQNLGSVSVPETLPKPAAIINETPEPVKVVKSKPLESSMTVDPSPSNADLGIKEKAPVKPVEKAIERDTMPIETGARLTPEAKDAALKQQSRYDTLLQFATVELEGTLQRKHK